LLRGTGLRRAEVAALDLADYDVDSGEMTVANDRDQSERIVYIPAGARATLNDGLMMRGSAPGPLFYGVVKGGKLAPRRLAGQAFALICAHRAAEAGIAPLTPHDMRRTFISGLLDGGAELTVVQHLAGHADQATTARYDARGEAAKRRAVEQMHIPHFERPGPLSEL
jgi:integrase